MCVVARTDRLLLRSLDPDTDADFVVELLNDAAWLRYIGDKGVRTRLDARRYLEEGPVAMYGRAGFGLYAVESLDDGVPVGICGLVKRDGLADVDLGFALLPAFRGRGYALEAARATLAHAWAGLGLSRIVAIVTPDNERSRALLARLGFCFERTLQLAPDASALELHAIGHP